MLNKQGFDLWANNYDETVQISEENNLYPFAGYKAILNLIFNETMQKEKSYIFDIGFGTGILTSNLYDHGHHIDGVDFSAEMIALAQVKMPAANLMEWDITNGLPEAIKEKSYDSIISTYALHHLEDEQKVVFIKELLSLLKKDGTIYIGDIAFRTRQQLETCRQKSIGYWDEDEFYFVYEELAAMLEKICKCEFSPVSHCGGVIKISN
ncbi:class I SAM-dependent methyltransferase [Planococcus sp. YIM B11945]|uniref:class I SAM-dependent methyltransferase n=1 Tax=Planococcus sp. YIM B11945 TaxID=3435410 RepID=UPI003D7CE03E